MEYQCKVLDKEFLVEVNRVIDEQIKLYHSDTSDLSKAFIRLDLMDTFQRIWKKPSSTKNTELLDYLDAQGILKPKYTIKTFKKEDCGLQSSPRIFWNDKIEKIDDIDQIISFRRI